MSIFLNVSNHPSDAWGEKEREEAEKIGEIIDLPFPSVPSTADEALVACMADELMGKIMNYHPAAVMVQGEFTLSYALVKRLRSRNIPACAACSERISFEKEGKKVSEFHFERFRYYE